MTLTAEITEPAHGGPPPTSLLVLLRQEGNGNLTSGAGLYDTPTRTPTRHPQAHHRPSAPRFRQAFSLEARNKPPQCGAPHLRGVVYPSGRAYEASPSRHRSHLRGVTATPSYVAFTDSEHLVGDAAKNQVAMNPHHTVFDAKRLICCKPEVQADMKHFPFEVINKAGKLYIQVQYRGETKEFSPEEISSMFLGKMRGC